MLICSIKKWKQFYVPADMLDNMAPFIDANLVTPITNFGQYLSHTTAPVTNPLIARYFGTDIAKTLQTFEQLEHVIKWDMFLKHIITFLETQTGCKFEDSTESVVLYDSTAKQIIYTFPNKKLSEYQCKILKDGRVQYVSKLDNIIISTVIGQVCDPECDFKEECIIL